MMKKVAYILLTFLLIAFNEVKAQQSDEPVFMYVEQMPQFVGGESALMKFIQQNLVYPIKAKENGIQGKVYVSFIVTTTGELTDINVVRDIGEGCGEEAIRVMKLMPKWIPGKQNGMAVKTKMVLPFRFSLDTDNPLEKPNKAQFPGGEESLKSFVKTNLQYPVKEKKSKINANAEAKILISKEGELMNFEITKSLGKNFDKEIKRVIGLMPKKWLAAYRDGNYVDDFVIVSFEFNNLKK